MLPDSELGEGPEVEDIHGDDDASEAGHDDAALDEGDSLDGERDESGGADDDLEDDTAGADEGQAGKPDQVRGQKKGSSDTIRALRRRAQEAEERAIRAEAAEQERQRQTSFRSQAEMEAAERAKLELMGPDEKAEYLVNKTRSEVQNEIRQLRFEQADTKDQTRFEGLCARKPHFADIAEDVEAELVKMRRNGGSAPRETIALYLLGKRADERAARSKGKQQKRGQENISRQSARPAAGRSDVRGGDERRGGDGRAARAKRLTGIEI